MEADKIKKADSRRRKSKSLNFLKRKKRKRLPKTSESDVNSLLNNSPERPTDDSLYLSAAEEDEINIVVTEVSQESQSESLISCESPHTEPQLNENLVKPVSEKRIADLIYFANELKNYRCPRSRVCGGDLSSAKIEGISDMQGLLSSIILECESCKKRGLKIPPRTRITANDQDESPDLNNSAVLGAMSSGGGHYLLEQVLATIGVKPMTRKSKQCSFKNLE